MYVLYRHTSLLVYVYMYLKLSRSYLLLDKNILITKN